MESAFLSPRNRLSSASVRSARPCHMLKLLHVANSLDVPINASPIRKTSARSPAELPPYMDESQLEFLDSLGTGAFGRAIKVRHRDLGHTLVLKEVLTECEEHEAALLREISLLCNLKHPNILRCIAVVIRNRKISLLTEYIARGCLHSILVDPLGRPLPWSTRVSFAKDIATGMAFLHQNGIIHRDLTTFNCLVRQNNSVVVSDFGLSKFVSQPLIFFPASTKQTPGYGTDELPDKRTTTNKGTGRCGVRARRHTVVGSPFWMAPEMLASKPYNTAIDVYSFGMIICQLLARCEAEPDCIPRDPISMAVDMNQFLLTGSIPDDRPDVLVALATRCVKLDPNLRPTFPDCVDWLEDYLFYSGIDQILPNKPHGRTTCEETS